MNLDSAYESDLAAIHSLWKPGVYRGLPSSQYFALPFLSQSRLKMLAVSPAHYRASLTEPEETTAAMRRGSALHASTLEPERFAAVYAEPEQCAAETAKKTRCKNGGTVRQDGKWYCGTHWPVGRFDKIETLPEGEWTKMLGMGESLRRHWWIRRMLDQSTDKELTLVWDDPGTGIRCKARLDLVVSHWQLIGDVKSTQDASPEDFGWTVHNFRYHCQAAFYLDGAKACGLPVSKFAFAAVECERPHVAEAYQLDKADIELGRQQNARLMRKLAECRQSNKWPAYSSDGEQIHELRMPDAARRKAEKELVG